MNTHICIMPKLFVFLYFLFLHFRGVTQPLDVNYSGVWGFMTQAGVNWFFGDIGGIRGVGQPFAKDWNLKGTTPNVAASVLYNATNRMAFRLQVSAGSLKSDDKYLPLDDNSGRRERNLNFRTSLFEACAGVQLNYRYFVDYAVDNEPTIGRFYPHAFVGIGLFYANPKALYEGSWVALRPLRTEGQGMAEYPDRKLVKPINLYFPVSLGLNYNFNEGLGMHLECMWRKSSTDYVDDVSARYINPALFDKYLTPEQTKIARALHDRSGELNNGRSINKEGDIRGLPDKDSWVSFNLGITYNLWRKKYY